MLRRNRPIWLLALVMVFVLFLSNRARVDSLKEVDVRSIADRARIHRQLDSLEARVAKLEEGGWSR